MLELKISPDSPGIITQTFKKINDLVRSGTIDSDTPVRIVLMPGVYQGTISYNLPNPLIMQTPAGTKPEDCLICAENCEAFHKDTENRAVFVIGMGATDVTLKGFSIEYSGTGDKVIEQSPEGNYFAKEGSTVKLLLH